jgi:hypothetical protein
MTSKQGIYMKKILLPIIAIIGFCVISHAQCDKNIVFASSKTDYLDAHDSLQRSANESVNVAIKKTDITVVINEDADTKLTGTGKLISCDWKVPFKEGKMIYKAQLTDVRGDSKNVTLTIEGKDGKATLFVEIETMPDRKMRLIADEFDERN